MGLSEKALDKISWYYYMWLQNIENMNSKCYFFIVIALSFAAVSAFKLGDADEDDLSEDSSYDKEEDVHGTENENANHLSQRTRDSDDKDEFRGLRSFIRIKNFN